MIFVAVSNGFGKTYLDIKHGDAETIGKVKKKRRKGEKRFMLIIIP
jgi:hypothetical protein